MVNFVYFPRNLMTKYGYESGSIVNSRLRAGIDDKIDISKKIIQILIFAIPTWHFLTLTIDCKAKHSHL